MIAIALLLVLAYKQVYGFGLRKLSMHRAVLRATEVSSDGDDMDFIEIIPTKNNKIYNNSVDISIDPASVVACPIPEPPTTKKLPIAIVSAALGVFSFAFIHNQPASSVALLKAMERDSQNIETVICNGKPTIVDFYADWCESCKAMAPSMRALENKYKGSINYITMDATEAANVPFVRAFRVDAIPHVAFITPDAEVKTALVGAVPKKILEEDMQALVANKPLPYEGYDAFEDMSHFPLNKVYSACKLTN